MKKDNGLNIFFALLIPFLGLAIKLIFLDMFKFNLFTGASYCLFFGLFGYFVSKKLFAIKNTKFEGQSKDNNTVKKIPTPRVVYIVAASSALLSLASIIW